MADKESKATADVKPEADELAAQLRRLGQELVDVADDSFARTAKLREVESFLGKLRVADFPDLAESPVIQGFVRMFADTVGLKPGETKNKGSLAEFGRDWTWDDVCRSFPSKVLIPIDSVPLTWNGVGPLYVRQGEEVSIPEPFYDLYREHVRALRQADIHMDYMMGRSDRPPDPAWFSDHTAKARAQSQMKGPTGQPGAFYIPGSNLPARAGGDTTDDGGEKQEGVENAGAA